MKQVKFKLGSQDYIAHLTHGADGRWIWSASSGYYTISHQFSLSNTAQEEWAVFEAWREEVGAVLLGELAPLR